MSWIETFVQRMFPDSEVHRDPHDAKWIVVTRFRDEELFLEVEALRKVSQKLTPRRRKPRRYLRMGRKH